MILYNLIIYNKNIKSFIIYKMDKYNFLFENAINLYKINNTINNKTKPITQEQVKTLKYFLDNINYKK